jgi:sialate O-acetylesterase
MKNNLLSLICIIFFACEFNKFDSEVSLPKLISNGMVIQRDQKIPVWGKGIPGKKVRVTLADLIGSTEVEPDSTWSLQFPSMAAGGPYQLQVNEQIIQDVYIGDVWLAGGQSNMEWSLKSQVIGGEEEIKSGGIHQIRFFKVPNSYSAIPQEDVAGGEWKIADSVNLPQFSAVAWFFAKRNHLEKNVPVGIVEANWGGTPAEGWTDANILAKMGESYSVEAKDILENQEKWEKIILENENKRRIRGFLVTKPDSVTALKVASLDFDDSQWKTIQLPKSNPLKHIAWVRKRFEINSLEAVKLHIPDLDQMAFVYLNGKQIHHKDWGFAMPDIDISTSDLRKGQNVLTFRVLNTWNNEPQIGKQGEMYLLQKGKKISLEGSWSFSNDLIEPMLPKVDYYNWKPGLMYNSMILPLTKFPIKGVIWYQGESNTARHREYKSLFQTLISSWRGAWGIGDFPFLFVQLANFMERKDVQPDSEWAYLREAQAQTLELPATGMAVSIDIGEAGDIHPKNKKDVGERLWLQARKIAFGEKILASGPVVVSSELVDGDLFIEFGEIGEGLRLSVGKKVKGFVIADDQGNFQAADGEIVGKSRVKIAIPKGVKFAQIRYGWADNPEVNLVNSLNLPTAPFRF